MHPTTGVQKFRFFRQKSAKIRQKSDLWSGCGPKPWPYTHSQSRKRNFQNTTTVVVLKISRYFGTHSHIESEYQNTQIFKFCAEVCD